MAKIKKYAEFLESLQIDVMLTQIDLNESLGLFYENLLQSIGAEEIDIYDTFTLPKDEFSKKMNLDLLSTDPNFINSLSSIGLKKSTMQNTDDLETFLNKPCRFLMVYRIEANELENPSYIIFQSWNETVQKWDEPKLYRITGDIKKFYDKLSSKSIVIRDGEESYIYSTSNKNEWTLQTPDKESETYKKVFRRDEFEKMINDKVLKLRKEYGDKYTDLFRIEIS